MNKNAVINSEYFLKENSVLKAASIVQWKKNNDKYNFKTLPKTAIISLNKFVLDRKKRFASKKIKGLIGQNFLLNQNVIFCSEFGNGAPSVIGILEELRELGVENFIFVGLAGLIDEKAKEGVFLVNNSFSTVGSTSFYSVKDNFEPKNNTWYTNLKSLLNLPETTSWSTDAPFRETKSLLQYFIEKKATHVDMECAAIYAFAEFYNVNAMCIILTADDLSSYNWNPPKDLRSTNTHFKQLITKLIKLTNA